MATKYIEGTTIKVKSEFRDASNILVDPSTVTLKYKKPDLTVTTLSGLDITKTAVGFYEAIITLADPGKYTFRWEGSGNTGSVNEVTINVQASQVI